MLQDAENICVIYKTNHIAFFTINGKQLNDLKVDDDDTIFKFRAMVMTKFFYFKICKELVFLKQVNRLQLTQNYLEVKNI